MKSNLNKYEDVSFEREEGMVDMEGHLDWYKKAFEWSPIGIAFIDAKGDIFHTNSTLNQMLGYAESLPFKKITDLIKFDFKVIENAVKASDHLNGEYQIDHSSGQMIWVQVLFTPILLPDNSLAGFAVHIMDITSNKKAEQELESTEKLTLA